MDDNKKHITHTTKAGQAQPVRVKKDMCVMVCFNGSVVRGHDQPLACRGGGSYVISMAGRVGTICQGD